MLNWKAKLPFWPKGRKIVIKGEVVNEDDIRPDQKGDFQRAPSVFRRQELDAETVVPGRICLFACYGCPWAHRAILARHLKGLEDAVPLIATEGWWPFTKGMPAITTGGWRINKPLPDAIMNGASADLKAHAQASPFYLWRLYTSTDPLYTGRVTIPVLWDSDQGKLVCNESSDVLRIFNSPVFAAMGSPTAPNLYPKELQQEIDELNPKIYEFNNGVYKCGFAGSEVFLQERIKLFEAMDFLEARLRTRRYLCGEALTECDVRCYTTLVRFDTAYYNAFRCNLRRVRYAYPNLQRYLCELYSLRAFHESSKGMIIGYPLMYFCICKWQGRRLSNFLRICELALFAAFHAMAPDTPRWRFFLVTLLALPIRALNKFVDPLPNHGLL